MGLGETLKLTRSTLNLPGGGLHRNDFDFTENHLHRLPDAVIIFILGALSLVSPFAVDMYLPAFPRVAAQFHTDTSAISCHYPAISSGLHSDRFSMGRCSTGLGANRRSLWD